VNGIAGMQQCPFARRAVHSEIALADALDSDPLLCRRYDELSPRNAGSCERWGRVQGPRTLAMEAKARLDRFSLAAAEDERLPD
jgi:hypothetical protein